MLMMPTWTNTRYRSTEVADPAPRKFSLIDAKTIPTERTRRIGKPSINELPIIISAKAPKV
jgi:hypothetical protein